MIAPAPVQTSRKVRSFIIADWQAPTPTDTTHHVLKDNALHNARTPQTDIPWPITSLSLPGKVYHRALLNQPFGCCVCGGVCVGVGGFGFALVCVIARAHSVCVRHLDRSQRCEG